MRLCAAVATNIEEMKTKRLAKLKETISWKIGVNV